jgi:hypothetical protein
MRTSLSVILILVLARACIAAEPLRVVENSAFSVGETFEYSLSWEFINAGSARMSISETVTMSDRPAYHVVSEAWSNTAFSLFFRVHDKVETWIDVDGIYPLRYEKHIDEGDFTDHRLVVFDHAAETATTPKQIYEMPRFAQDALSVLYYFRTLDFAVGDSVDIDNFTDRKVYPLRVIVHRREKVKVRAGTFDCLVVEPVLRGPTIFEAKGTLLVWITDDEFKMPVLMKSSVVIGSIVAELTDFTRGGQEGGG